MERPTISVTVHSASTLTFYNVIYLEDELEVLCECEDPTRFDVDECLRILNQAKDLPWTKYRTRQHLCLFESIWKLTSYGRDKISTTDKLMLKRQHKLKMMRKLCRNILRTCMAVFGVENFDTLDDELKKYEKVFRSGFPTDVFYMADEPVADAILCELDAITLTATQQINFERCQNITLQQFIDTTNIRELVVKEIERLCLNDQEKLDNNIADVEWHIRKVFAIFLQHKQSWCYTLLRDLEISDEGVCMANADDQPAAEEPANSLADEQEALVFEDKRYVSMIKSLVRENEAMMKATLKSIMPFLLSVLSTNRKFEFADFLTYANNLQAIGVQTTEPDTSIANAICVAATSNSSPKCNFETQPSECVTTQLQPFMSQDTTIFLSSQLADALDGRTPIDSVSNLQNKILAAPIQKTSRLDQLSYFSMRNHLTFAQISEITFHIVRPTQSFTIDLQLFGNSENYCLNEMAVRQLLNFNAEQWSKLRQVFVDVGIFVYRANKKLPADSAPQHKYLDYLFRTIDLLRDCISMVPDMHSRYLHVSREPVYVHVERPALCLDGIVDSEILQKMCKKQ